MVGEGKQQFKIIFLSSACVALFLLSFIRASAEEKSGVIISEIMWDGVEYVELYNSEEKDVDLNGWSLWRQRVGKDEELIFEFEEEESIVGGGYYLIEKKEEATSVIGDKIVSKLTLLNSGERLMLKDSEGVQVDGVEQMDEGGWLAGENTDDGISMEWGGVNWHTSIGSVGGRLGTPGEENSEGRINNSPEAAIVFSGEFKVGQEIVFSGEDSSDIDGDDLIYEWDVNGESFDGVEVEHVFNKAGIFEVNLLVSDGELEDEENVEIEIEKVVFSDDVVISEFLPNPVGADAEGELIELKNTGNDEVDLDGWQLDDEEDGGSKIFVIEDVVLGGGKSRLFKREETKIALNNSGDDVRLLSPNGELKHAASYDSSTEGESYILEDGEFVETNNLEDDDKEEDEEVEGQVAGDSLQVIELAKIRDYQKGEEVQFEGVVSVGPGPLGEKIIYLAGSGVQVYMNSEEWPELVAGDKVKVTGEISSYLGETRVKLAQVSDIEVMAQEDEPVPHEVKTGEIGEENEGWLVVIAGEVVKTSGDTFYVDDDSGEVKIYIKSSTEIDKPKMSKGSKVTIIGVVSQTTSGYRILPRWQEDVRLGIVAGLTRFPAVGGARSATGFELVWFGLPMLVAGWQLVSGKREQEPLIVR